MTQPAPAARSASPPAPLGRSPWLSMPDVDVLVVGAGPAGAVAAWYAKQAAPELDVVLLERDRAVGAPVRCAEGVETMVGRWAGLDTRVPARDMESCAQYVLQDIDINPDAIYLQFSTTIAPGGYAWIFPKAVGVANVGLGIVALKADGRNARQYLDDWVARRFPGGIRTGYTVGGVIVHTTIKKTYTDGVMIAGDAAHMINPLSGGGITNAMKAGRLAGKTAAAAICAGDTSERRLAAYHHAWMELLGDDHLKYYRIKQALEGVDDASFNKLARSVNNIAPGKRTIGRVFTHALI